MNINGIVEREHSVCCYNIELSSIKFPGGEIHTTVKNNYNAEKYNNIEIFTLLKNSDDIMELLMATDAIKRLYNVPINLYMPYVPYARQDRITNVGEALSIKVFCELINSQKYNKVVITDPHSDVTPALLNNVEVMDNIGYTYNVIKSLQNSDLIYDKDIALVSPDAGARKRTLHVAKKLSIKDVVFADKIRDTLSGQITGTTINNIVPDLPLLVIDDIVDGGKTFIELAKTLREQTNQPLYLYVTHGIFSKGQDEILSYYDKIFTAYNWNENCDKVITINYL